MSSWAERVHRRAADFSSVVTSCGHPGSSAPTYPYRLEKVKFGVPLEEVCKNDNIPGPLLVLILKLNKESPNRRDVFRAPGHQGAMKKLIHFLQAGRLVNVDNYSVYTIASVLKKFLRKIPNGIFGRSGEEELFAIIELSNESEQIERLHKLLQSLPKYTQHLLVLLFGTFRVIASNAAHAGTGMTSEALGVSVAPSFFQSCVSDGKTARMEDVLKFKVATKIMKHVIDKFATHDLFGRENYEYYARVTGRILKVQDEWICSFQYPPPPRGKQAQQKYALQHSLEAEKTWLQCQCERWGLLAQEESRSTPALLTSSSSALDNSVVSLGVTPEHSFMESCARLSVSLEGPGLFAMTSSPLPARKRDLTADDDDDDIDEDDYNNDGDADDHHEVDDDEEDNDNNHINDYLQQAQHLGQQAEHDTEDFTHELDISHNGSGGGGGADGYNENVENQSYKANFLSGLTSTTNSVKARKLKCRSTVSSNEASRSGTSVERDDINFTDSQDDIDDEMNSVIKRRYKQNKKKSTINNTAQIRAQQQQQRRFRSSATTTCSAVATTSSNIKNSEMKPSDNLTNEYEYIGKPPTTVATTASTQTLKALAVNTVADSMVQQKSRVCSRCKRGIRHSSSCSSSTASGGGGGIVVDGSGMTMDELRAVNRYAESTKSLSYLPQVHERQTARMRTRSEWFLGPKDGDLLCVPPNTCSNCCLSAVNLPTVGNYMGGGSTRDMRRMEHHKSANAMAMQQPPLTPLVNEAVNTSFYLYYKQRQQQLQLQQYHQQQQLPLQRQSFHLSPEHMDIDESFSTSFVETGQQMNLHSMQQQLKAIQQQQRQQQLQLQQPSHHFSTRQAQEGQGIFLDTNYGRYDFDDKDILTITTTNANDITYNNNNNNNNSNNNNNNDIKENHNNINNNNNYTLSNRYYLKTSTTTTTINSNATTTSTTCSSPTHLPSLSSSLSLYHLHANSRPRKNSLSSIPPTCSHHNMSQYYSTESILINPKFTMASSEANGNEDPTACSSKLAYHSLRQQQHDNILSSSTLNTLNANTISTTSNTTTTTTTSDVNNSLLQDSCDGVTLLSKDIEDIMDLKANTTASHYRHSTPMIQRRRLRQQAALRRQRTPSTSSSLYQSFNASLQAPMASANLVGNIRLSNSAESVQYPVRRPSTRRILLGANIPRQYPLRSSLRRHKEKQKGTNNNSNNNNNANTGNSTTRPNSTSSLGAVGALNPGVSNSNNESLTASSSTECCNMESSITFKPPRL
ncbi:hypothetical protein DOY81_004245 [Sarcophaga bullata]|nr:hypothetical protein DOY81_004245 [Sarcophaga bullata]